MQCPHMIKTLKHNCYKMCCKYRPNFLMPQNNTNNLHICKKKFKTICTNSCSNRTCRRHVLRANQLKLVLDGKNLHQKIFGPTYTAKRCLCPQHKMQQNSCIFTDCGSLNLCWNLSNSWPVWTSLVSSQWISELSEQQILQKISH
jgi:hypothetical protein